MTSVLRKQILDIGGDVDGDEIEAEMPSDGPRGLIRLGITIALIVGASITLHIGGAVAVIMAILAMIMLHEFGHFITARWAGMKVTDFFVGFGPNIWTFKRGDTRYGIKAIPAGGFVRVIGMNNLDPIDDPADEPRTYRSKSYFQRVRFAVAGTTMHFLIAFVLMVVLLAGFGRVLDTTPPSTTISEVVPTLTASGPAGPAAKAGLLAGDKILSIGTQRITSWDQASRLINASPGKTLLLTIQRGDTRQSISVTPTDPRPAAERAKGEVGFIGIRPAYAVTKLSWPSAVWHAGFELRTLTHDTFFALKGMFSASSVESYGRQLSDTKSGSADPAKDGNRLLSPLGIGRVADAAAKDGGASVLSLLIAINVFVGIFNMIPLPPFDGGHVAVATYEAIRSRRGRRYMVDMNKLLPVAYAVIMGLMLLSASALYLDIVHPFNLG